MQIKKRARSVKFGKKIESHEKKREVKEEAIVKEEKKIEKEAAGIVSIDSGAANEKNNAQTNQKESQIKEEVQAPITQNQEVVHAPPANAAMQTVSTAGQEVVHAPPANPALKTESPVDDNDYIVQTEVKKNSLRYFIVVAVISFLIGLISMAVISFFLSGKLFETPFITRKVVVATPSPKPTVTVEPTKAIEVDLAEYSIEVLNGSGISGVASELKTELTTDGFKVISAGNADKSDYTNTIISAKKKVRSAYLEKLKENLKKTYTLDSDSKTVLAETNEADVIITIGSSISGN